MRVDQARLRKTPYAAPWQDEQCRASASAPEAVVEVTEVILFALDQERNLVLEYFVLLLAHVLVL